jgi:raffinose/stachyose/melibiose transport system permease protein
MTQRRGDTVIAGWFLLPALAFFGVFIVYPFIDVICTSLTSWDGFTAPTFVGLGNYGELFKPDGLFLKALGNTTLFAAYTVVGKNVLALLLAVLLNSRIRFRTFYRTALFLPVCLSFVAVGVIWAYIFNPSFGILNALLSVLGKREPISWLGEPGLALACVAFVDVWKWTGYHVVLYLAGLQMIPADLYEASALDGASPLQNFAHITLPQLLPVVLINVIISLMGAYSVFDVIFVMTRGGPYNSTQTILTYMFDVTFREYHIGLGSAVVVVLFALIIGMTVIQNRIGRRAEA